MVSITGNNLSNRIQEITRNLLLVFYHRGESEQESEFLSNTACVQPRNA